MNKNSQEEAKYNAFVNSINFKPYTDKQGFVIREAYRAAQKVSHCQLSGGMFNSSSAEHATWHSLKILLDHVEAANSAAGSNFTALPPLGIPHTEDYVDDQDAKYEIEDIEEDSKKELPEKEREKIREKFKKINMEQLEKIRAAIESWLEKVKEFAGKEA